MIAFGDSYVYHDDFTYVLDNPTMDTIKKLVGISSENWNGEIVISKSSEHKGDYVAELVNDYRD